METTIQIDVEKLSRCLAEISLFCKGKLRFYDNATSAYISYGRENLRFCSMLSRTPQVNCLCTRCNEDANARCRERRAGFSYFCHSGLIEIIQPVFFEGNYVGNVGVGQFRSRSRSVDETYLAQLSELAGIDLSRLKQAYNALPFLSDRGVHGAQLILEMTARRLEEDGVFSISGKGVVAEAERYILAHLTEKLSLQSVAKHCFINPSYLSDQFHRTTGLTITHFIQQKRIAHAQYLFSNSTMSIAEIAAASGFTDPNYFTKVFKTELGCTPQEYRKMLAVGQVLY